MKNFITLPTATLRQIMKQIDQLGKRCLVVADEQLKLLGTISDGDIRKAFLKGCRPEDSIEYLYCRNPRFISESSFTRTMCRELLLKEKLDLIPIVNKSKIITKIYFSDLNIFPVYPNSAGEINAPLVVMAGGKGTRMEPLTKVLPKALIPINDKPIIEHILDRFSYIGCVEFYISLNYKSRIIKAYFEDEKKWNNVKYCVENKPSGTIGSLRKLRTLLNSPFFVSNCDIIVNADIKEIYRHHIQQENSITIVATTKCFIIPYGECQFKKNGSLIKLIEKPQHTTSINTGLYVLNQNVLSLIPDEKVFHMTDLIDVAVKRQFKVGVFSISEDSWIDVGQLDEYKRFVSSL